MIRAGSDLSADLPEDLLDDGEDDEGRRLALRAERKAAAAEDGLIPTEDG